MDSTLADLASGIGDQDEDEDEENEEIEEVDDLSVDALIAKYTSSSPTKKIPQSPVSKAALKVVLSPSVVNNTLEENCAVSSNPLAWWSFLHKDCWMLVVEDRDTVPFRIKLEALQVTIYWTLLGIF